VSRVAPALALLLLAAAPELASAASEGGEGGHGSLYFWQGVNLVALIAILVYVARKPLLAFFSERRETVEAGIEGARRELAAAEARLAECQARVDRLDQEIAEIQRVVREQAEAERDRLLAEARQTAERIRRDAAAAAEQEIRRAREALRGETVELAVKLAAELLAQQVNQDDRTRLLDDFVQRVATAPVAATRS